MTLRLKALVLIGALVLIFHTPTHVPKAEAQSYTVKTSHPRMWITPARLTQLKSYRTRNTALWQRLKGRADANEGLPDALVYQVSGDATYCTGSGKAISQIMSEAVSSNTLTRDSYYD